MKLNVVLRADPKKNVVIVTGSFSLEYTSKKPAFDAARMVKRIEAAAIAAGATLKVETEEPKPRVRDTAGYKAAKAKKERPS
jgi:hypothetical protein